MTMKMSVGDEIKLTGMKVHVTEVEKNGSPIEATFTFDRNLDDDSFVWVHWTSDSFASFTLPKVGESYKLYPPGLPFGVTNKRLHEIMRRALY